jgi:hypothetical protein
MPSRSRQLRAVRALDKFHPLRERLSHMGQKVGEWAGIPLPIEDQRLIVAPQMPFAGLFDKPEPDHGPDAWRVRNTFYSCRWRADVSIIEREGKIRGHWEPAFHHIGHDLQTMGASVAWGLEQEQRALQLLGTMIRHHAMKAYILTGMFLERSPRSGVTYVFRRLKPTVALAPFRGVPGPESARILCSLCMHPIAYYAGSWAGAMCPTDDVIAHLSLMRADEHMFWKRCSQHPPYRPEAGL